MRRSLREGGEEEGEGEKGMEISPSSGREQRMEEGGVEGRSFLLGVLVGRSGSVLSIGKILIFSSSNR